MLIAYEQLADSVVHQVRGFYFIGVAPDGEDEDEISLRQYVEKVLEPSKVKFKQPPKEWLKRRNDSKEFFACCGWLVESGALTPDDVITLGRVRDVRNAVAHNAFDVIARDAVSLADLDLMVAMSKRIDDWFLLNVELAINPEYDDQDHEEIMANGATSLRAIILRLLQQIAHGDDGEAVEIVAMLRAIDSASNNTNTQSGE